MKAAIEKEFGEELKELKKSKEVVKPKAEAVKTKAKAEVKPKAKTKTKTKKCK